MISRDLDAKEIAYVGVMKCSKCGFYSHFSVYEVSKKTTVYFIPVTKAKTTYRVICSNCGAWDEMDQAGVDSCVEASRERPAKETVTRMWDEMSRRWNDLALNSKDAEAMSQGFMGFLDTLKKSYAESHVAWVAGWFMAYMRDQNAPGKTVVEVRRK